MQVTPELLGFFPLMKRLSRESLVHLSDVASVEKLARRAVVLERGEQQNSVCFLFEGRLQGVDFTVDGREVGLFFVEPGDYCGELALFDFGPQPEYIIVIAPAVVVRIPAESMRQIMLVTPAMVADMGHKLARRLREMTLQRSLLALPSIPQRVCCQLWLLIPATERNEAVSAIIRNPPTHMEIAIMLNLSRETVTRVFQQLQAKSIVRRDGTSQLLIQNPQELKNLAEGATEL